VLASQIVRGPRGSWAERRRPEKEAIVKAVFARNTYDTDLATEVARRDNGRALADARWWRETLYERAGDRALFLHAAGGRLSRYSAMRDGISVGREAIHPLSGSEAGRWLRSVTERGEGCVQAPQGGLFLVGDR
jgi:N-formylglutamate amidohydrolase